MRRDKKVSNSVLSAIAGVIVVIALLAVMNYYASGWDKTVGIESSFLATFFSFLAAIVILFAAFCVGVALSNRPRRRQNRVVILDNHWYTRLGILLRRRRP